MLHIWYTNGTFAINSVANALATQASSGACHRLLISSPLSKTLALLAELHQLLPLASKAVAIAHFRESANVNTMSFAC